MASDLTLVLRSEHRELRTLAGQCRRPSRGFQEPDEQLRRRLAAHVVALEAAVGHSLPDGSPGYIVEALAHVRSELGAPTRQGVAAAAEAVVAAEERGLIPVLERLLVVDRRRMGKVFRMKRDAALRHEVGSPIRRKRSQPELYELARRAGVEHRSSMTLAQLEAAVIAWERTKDQPAPNAVMAIRVPTPRDWPSA